MCGIQREDFITFIALNMKAKAKFLNSHMSRIQLQSASILNRRYRELKFLCYTTTVRKEIMVPGGSITVINVVTNDLTESKGDRYFKIDAK